MPLKRARQDSIPFSPKSPHANQQAPTPMDTSFNFSESSLENAFSPTDIIMGDSAPFSPVPAKAAPIGSQRQQPSAAAPFTTTAAPRQLRAAEPALPVQQLQQPTPFSITSRRAAKNGAFREKLKQMALPLAPLVQLTTGEVHPSFPGTLLNFWLLNDDQLEDLARFYHQRTPCIWTLQYPMPVRWNSGLSLEEKRRKLGKFIGLRGCETPVHIKTEQELLDEARRARAAAAEDELWRRKFWQG